MKSFVNGEQYSSQNENGRRQPAVFSLILMVAGRRIELPTLGLRTQKRCILGLLTQLKLFN